MAMTEYQKQKILYDVRTPYFDWLDMLENNKMEIYLSPNKKRRKGNKENSIYEVENKELGIKLELEKTDNLTSLINILLGKKQTPKHEKMVEKINAYCNSEIVHNFCSPDAERWGAAIESYMMYLFGDQWKYETCSPQSGIEKIGAMNGFEIYFDKK